jgi:hypothetical protein
MQLTLEQHQVEIARNRSCWQEKPLLQRIYGEFYRQIIALIDPAIPGQIVEIGSGMGNLKHHLPEALATDLFANDWLDLVCDGYELPFATGTLSHLILFDVFHHFQAPQAFLKEACRVLVSGGRLVLFEPYISWLSYPVYGLLHHEPVAWKQPISQAPELARPRVYYAAQGNATRMFFGQTDCLLSPSLPSRGGKGDCRSEWRIFCRKAWASFSYLLSGGFSKPALYPAAGWDLLRLLDAQLSHWPRIFGARCLIGLERMPTSQSQQTR